MIDDVLSAARSAVRTAPPVGDAAFRALPTEIARRVHASWTAILGANEDDVRAGREQGLSESMLARMTVEPDLPGLVHRLGTRVAEDLPRDEIVGAVRAGTGAARSLEVLRPLGVLLMIYEARPVVTIESAIMGAATGNAVLLRGGKEIARTNRVLADLLGDALDALGLPGGLITVLDSSDRSELRELLRRDDAVDVLVPRGSPSLVEFCRTASRIPMIVGGGGVNHLYVHADADADLAAAVTLDAKLPQPAGCTALEMLLVDRPALPGFLAALDHHVAAANDADALRLRVDHEVAALLPATLAAHRDPTTLGPQDDGREYLDPTLALRVVDGMDQAVDHVLRHGSGHTEGVVTGDPDLARRYARRVDAATVVVNGSLRLHDAPSLGLGAELAISTGRLHVRGPVTLGDLYCRGRLVDGHGTTRFRAPLTPPVHAQA